MATRRTVPVEIDIGTVALAELAATHHGMPVAEWIAKAARRALASISPGPDYVELTDAEMLAEDAQRAADDAAIAADEVPCGGVTSADTSAPVPQKSRASS